MKSRQSLIEQRSTAGLKSATNRQRGVTLTELVCVMAIIAILAALYLPSIAHAFLRVKKFLQGW